MRRPKTHFLNVDLDIQLDSGLSALIDSAQDSVIVLNRTETSASIELAQEYKSIDETVTAYVAFVESLSAPAKHLWSRCSIRSLNIGIRAGMSPQVERFNLSQSALASIAAIGCEVEISIYAPSQEQ
jgi:hypothetical protein